MGNVLGALSCSKLRGELTLGNNITVGVDFNLQNKQDIKVAQKVLDAAQNRMAYDAESQKRIDENMKNLTQALNKTYAP